MKLIGQRWIYRLGNSTVVIDNAFSWIGWSQERMIVNDETVQSSQGWLRTRHNYLEPWIVPGGEGLLTIRMAAVMLTVECSAELDGVSLEPTEALEARWSGPKRSWPEATEWRPVAF